MREVLISIKPNWVELIASGKKTVEVRKTRPKLETPFKVYIYCTKSNNQFLQSRSNMFFYCEDRDFIGGHGAGAYQRLNGKIIGEFVCDNVDRIAHCGTCNNDIRLNIVDKNLYCKALDYEYLNKCELSYSDIDEYSNGGDVYGWHISNLVIYEKPKELSKFCTVDNEAVKQCEHRERVYNNPDYTNGAYLLGSYVCNKDETDWCKKCKTKPITRPPQSWCYVESGGAE